MFMEKTKFRFKKRLSYEYILTTIKKSDIKRAELVMSVMKKLKNESGKEKQKLKGDILSNTLLNDKKINKATYNKTFALFMGSSQMNALEDAYNPLKKCSKPNEIKVVQKGKFRELKTKERTTRKINEGKKDKIMMVIKNKETLHKYRLTAISDRNITYSDKIAGIAKYIYT